MCCAVLMEQGCCDFGCKNGCKVLAHHLWNHALRNSYGARLLLFWQQKWPHGFSSPYHTRQIAVAKEHQISDVPPQNAVAVRLATQHSLLSLQQFCGDRKQRKRSYEIESFSKGCLWLRLGVWLWPDIWLHRCRKMVLQRNRGSPEAEV